MARKCDASEPTTIYPTALADYSAGMHLIQGILLALLQRERTGRGQSISVSLYDSMLAMQMQEAAMWLMRGRDFSWGAMPYTGVFATTDGAIVIVGAFKPNPLREISLALGLDDLSADSRFADLVASRRNRTALHEILRDRIASADTAHWLARLEERDLLAAPVRSLGEALADPQTAVNGMIVRRDGEMPLDLKPRRAPSRDRCAPRPSDASVPSSTALNCSLRNSNGRAHACRTPRERPQCRHRADVFTPPPTSMIVLPPIIPPPPPRFGRPPRRAANDRHPAIRGFPAR
jgi:crotonobetainyl-CoA:carnitine CoA-transferase CaiB-like acyl-CoA transferase